MRHGDKRGSERRIKDREERVRKIEKEREFQRRYWFVKVEEKELMLVERVMGKWKQLRE